jgi:hypothetical protein
MQIYRILKIRDAWGLPARVEVHQGQRCEGAKGEVARLAANLIAHRLAPENTVRICLGGVFTKDT